MKRSQGLYLGREADSISQLLGGPWEYLYTAPLLCFPFLKSSLPLPWINPKNLEFATSFQLTPSFPLLPLPKFLFSITFFDYFNTPHRKSHWQLLSSFCHVLRSSLGLDISSELTCQSVPVPGPHISAKWQLVVLDDCVKHRKSGKSSLY